MLQSKGAKGGSASTADFQSCESFGASAVIFHSYRESVLGVELTKIPFTQVANNCCIANNLMQYSWR